MGTFHQSKFSGFDYFSVIRSRRKKIYCHLNPIIFPPILVVIVFLEVELWSFNKLYHHVTYKNDIYKYSKRVIINHVTYRNGIILFAYAFQPSFINVVFLKVVM